jgi:hypothetical protein
MFFLMPGGGCPMDNSKCLILLATEDIPSTLALIALIGLWGLLTTAATIYCAALGS